jgi:transcriptional regulator of acetoin/glycerol metabolism
MTLVEAFRSLGCLLGDPAVDTTRQEAAAILLPELRRLALGLVRAQGFREELADDAVNEAFCSVMTGGNRSNAALACDSDQRVRGFLKECLRNEMLDEVRRHARVEQRDSVTTSATFESGHADSPEELAIAAEEIERRQAAQREFYERIVPELATTLRPEAGRDLTQAVQHMRALVADETDFRTVVTEATGKEDAAAQSAVHQRHSRARRRLVEYIESLAAAGRLTQQRAEDLRWCVGQLQRRGSS